MGKRTPTDIIAATIVSSIAGPSIFFLVAQFVHIYFPNISRGVSIFVAFIPALLTVALIWIFDSDSA